MMSNSKLVEYTKLSPNCSKPRKEKIKKITIHHMAGNFSLETVGRIFSVGGRGSSANYAVDINGKIGMYVEEKNRAWTSSSPENDHQAITIEVANDKIGGDWHVSDASLEKTIELCVDICKRNDIKQLNFTGDKSGNLTMHKWFINTICPGEYLGGKFPYIAEEVNKRLGNIIAASPEEKIDSIKPTKTVEKNYLIIGDKGNEVKELQKDLIKLGFSVGKSGVDGFYGINTKNGVKSFQRKHRLKVDGIAGQETQGKIDELLKVLDEKVSSKPKVNLKVDGYLGVNSIKALQKYFGTPIDGVISKPSLLIKAIQKEVGAKVDGYLGKETISKMQKHFGTIVDGVISEPSLMVKEMQRRLNKGTF